MGKGRSGETAMTKPSILLTESDVMTAVGVFLYGILPDGIEVVRGQDNRVAEPDADNFVVVTPILQQRLSTNVNAYFDGYSTVTDSTNTSSLHNQLTFQVDVHGPNSADNTMLISTYFKSDYGIQLFKSSNAYVEPLYCSDPRQIPFINSEQQVETRWSIDVIMDSIPSAQIVVTDYFAGELAVNTTPTNTTNGAIPPDESSPINGGFVDVQ